MLVENDSAPIGAGCSEMQTVDAEPIDSSGACYRALLVENERPNIVEHRLLALRFVQASAWLLNTAKMR